MRAPLLLVMAAASLAASPLARRNPWLSACDLDEPARACAAPAGRAPACRRAPALDVRAARALCARGPEERARRLRALRLPACCERAPLAALDAPARAAVRAGGPQCAQALLDLLELDALAARVHCAFSDILRRYDCEQTYSVRYACSDCQDTYRRWACSTLLPVFASAAELETGAGREPARGGLVGAGAARWRRAAAAGPGRPLVRLKPCLALCQSVEQQCPYFLPGDRAPAYPTQYAGEPTFLCLDPQIAETGEQARKSNYGPAECCYEHCADGELCYSCAAPLRRYDEPPPPPERCAPVESAPSPCAARAARPARTPPALLLLVALACALAGTGTPACSRSHRRRRSRAKRSREDLAVRWPRARRRARTIRHLYITRSVHSGKL